MKHLLFAIAVSVALIGCSDKGDSSAKPAPGTQAAIDVAAGKVLINASRVSLFTAVLMLSSRIDSFGRLSRSG